MVSIQKSLSSTEAEVEEWLLRRDMAAVFRIAARLGWNEHIGNHNSVMLPQREVDGVPCFLINPRGLLFQEVTASSLIVYDVNGRNLRGKGEVRPVAFHVHARMHLQNPAAVCIIHVHPQYLTALSMISGLELEPTHRNNLFLIDRMVLDNGGFISVDNTAEGDRLAAALGNKTILLMGSHGVTVVGSTVHDAFDECYVAERTAMYQVTAMSTGRRLQPLPCRERLGWTGVWGEKVDSRMHLDAWRRILDREEPDYAN